MSYRHRYYDRPKDRDRHERHSRHDRIDERIRFRLDKISP